MTDPRCLILACGNTLRSDDGVGLWLAEWAIKRFAENAEVRVIARHQWTLELAEDVARAESVLFIDCSVDSPAGSVLLSPVEAAELERGMSTHHSGAAELLALARDYYNSLPRHARQLTIGAGSTELGEVFSEAVTAALPEACRRIEEMVLQWVGV
jgi:hydrogenase maturation protease